MTHDFLHHLRDTIILLGGGTRLVNMVENAEIATEQDVAELRQINLRLIDAMKDRLVSLNSITIKTEASELD